jgi:hypothetical protein
VGSHRGEALTACAFSRDGSVLALGGGGGGVTLWGAAQTALLAVLPPPPGAGSPVRQLLFLARSPLLVAVSQGGVAVYDLLTRRCVWAADVALGAAAADPGSPHWAAVVLRSAGGGGAGGAGGAPAAAAAAGGDKQQRGGEGEGEGEGGVVAFRGAERAPAGAWALRRAGRAGGGAAAAALAFAPPGTTLHAAGAAASLPGMSPLLVLTAGREYGLARRDGAPPAAAAAALRRREAFPPTAFEAMYGQPAAAAAAAAAAAEAAAEPAVEARAVGGRPAWAALFDAPSHALPPLGTLCPAFLELLVGGGRGAEAEAEAAVA